MKVLAAVDKFRGTATAAQVATAIGHACWQLGHDCIERPLADGGEGTLEALGGANRTTLVTGPLGDPVNASWRLHRGTAIIEMACASGLMISGGKEKMMLLQRRQLAPAKLLMRHWILERNESSCVSEDLQLPMADSERCAQFKHQRDLKVSNL